MKATRIILLAAVLLGLEAATATATSKATIASKTPETTVQAASKATAAPQTTAASAAPESAAPASKATTSEAGGGSIKASDPRVTFIGRTKVDGGNVSFDWTGVYAKVRFTGSFLSFKVSDTKRNYYNVWLDGSMDTAPDKVLTVSGTDTTIVIFSAEELKARFGKDRKAAKAPHQVILQKRTEGNEGMTTVSEFITDGGFLQADAPKERIIEFIGDSYTCGYGTEAANTEHYKAETENQNLTYACAAARYFGADHIVTAHSGIGVARNYNGKIGDFTMPEHYLYTFDNAGKETWDAAASPLKPSITVIYLGTNDFSRGMQPSSKQFSKGYTTLLGEIKANYGEDHPILCVSPKHDVLMFEYVRGAIAGSGLKNVHLVALCPFVHNEVQDMGADGHPNHSGHLKIAYSVIPYIATMTGWEMTGEPVR